MPHASQVTASAQETPFPVEGKSADCAHERIVRSLGRLAGTMADFSDRVYEWKDFGPQGQSSFTSKEPKVANRPHVDVRRRDHHRLSLQAREGSKKAANTFYCC